MMPTPLPRPTAPKVGLIVLQTDETLENESRFYLNLSGSEITVLHSRIAASDTVNTVTLNAMRGRLHEALALFPQRYAFDVVAYACTSAAAIIGEQAITADIHAAVTTRHVTTPLTAAKAALAYLGARRIAYLAPYESEVSQTMQAELAAAGHTAIADDSFHESSDRAVAAIAPQRILDTLKQFRNVGADAVFVSCTNLNCAAIIPPAEQRLNCPVLSSNQTLWWHILHLAQCPPPPHPAWGRLRG